MDLGGRREVFFWTLFAQTGGGDNINASKSNAFADDPRILNFELRSLQYQRKWVVAYAILDSGGRESLATVP